MELPFQMKLRNIPASDLKIKFDLIALYGNNDPAAHV